MLANILWLFIHVDGLFSLGVWDKGQEASNWQEKAADGVGLWKYVNHVFLVCI